MVSYKTRAAAHLAGILVWANLGAAARGWLRGPLAGVRATRAAVGRLSQAARVARRGRGRGRVAELVALCEASGAARATLARNPEAAFVLAAQALHQHRYEDLFALVEPHVAADRPATAKCLGVRAVARIWRGDTAEALADLRRCARLRPQVSRDFGYDTDRAFAHSTRGEVAEARDAMADQYGLAKGDGVEDRLASWLAARLATHLGGRALHGSVGVVIGNYHNAVGHAILDPFHYYNLFRHQFDTILIVHPSFGGYAPQPLLAVKVLDQYVEQIDVSDPALLTFAWKHLGALKHGNMTFLLYNYWALNRMAHLARTDPDHPMARGRKYLTLPDKLVARAEAICDRNHVDRTRPVVVVHTRGHGYHKLSGQSFRNTDARNYVPALRRLVELGYQVVRIGDTGITSLRAVVPGLLELPFTAYHDPVLDLYFLSKCRFMISCQSGPCSYARAFGKPTLVVNAVYHYTLLPERQELFGFKHYRVRGRTIGVPAVLDAGAHLFDRTAHFDGAGVEVEDMTAEEILAATDEMLDWLDDPARPETPAQERFRELMAAAGDVPDPDHPLASPTADYVGYALPECRVSDAVCRLRPGYLPAEAAGGRPGPTLAKPGRAGSRSDKAA